MKEKWKNISGYEGLYEVSNTGKVKSLNYLGHGIKRELRQKTDRYGYKCVVLCVNRKRKNITVHRLVAETFIDNNSKYKLVDHIDRNRANNVLSNLRFVSSSMNNKNRSATVGTSKYKGVSMTKPNMKWRAEIKIKGKTISLGTFSTEKDAALSYDKAAADVGYTTNLSLGIL